MGRGCGDFSEWWRPLGLLLARLNARLLQDVKSLQIQAKKNKWEPTGAAESGQLGTGWETVLPTPHLQSDLPMEKPLPLTTYRAAA